VKLNSWSKNVKFLYIVEGMDESLEKAWTTKKSWRMRQTKPALTNAAAAAGEEAGRGSGAKAGARAPAQGRGAQEIATPKAKGRQQKNANGGDDSCKKNTAAKRKSELREAMLQAKKRKTQLNTTLSQANTILSNIQTDPKWGWASGKESSGEISRIKKEIDDLVAGDDFTRELLSVTDLAELKGQEGRNDSALATLLNTFTAAMDPKVGSLIYQCKVLLAQYKARLSV